MKKQVNYVIEETVRDAFNVIAKSNALNKSQWLENKMFEYIQEHHAKAVETNFKGC